MNYQLAALIKEQDLFMNKIIFLIFLPFIFLTSCQPEYNYSKKYDVGFTPFPFSYDANDLNWVYTKINANANVISHHFDSGIPWQEALDNKPFHNNIMEDWEKRRSCSNLKILLSVTPINIWRERLAPYRSEKESEDLPSPWNNYNFDEPAVKTAYLNYCKRAIDYFKPAYFCAGIEVNLLKKNAPSRWTTYIELHKFIYTELKKIYPEVPIFLSFTGYDLAGYTDASKSSQQEAFNEILPYSDYFGLSLHPQCAQIGNNLPGTCGSAPSKDEIKTVFNLSEKPIAITETSYSSEWFTLFYMNFTFYGDEEKQRKYFENLFDVCDTHQTVFVINYLVRDYDLIWEYTGFPDNYYKVWKDTGLWSETGCERAILKLWKSRMK